jgi:hypothetical protein
VTERRGRRRRKLLDDQNEREGYSYLKDEALDHTIGELTLEEALDLSWDRRLNETLYQCYHVVVIFN